MKINWKVRFKNPQFIAQVILAIFVPVFAYFGITGQDMTTWPILFNTLIDALRNPYVVFTIIVSVYNSINDPTVAGLSDSKQARGYYKPKKDEDYL